MPGKMLAHCDTSLATADDEGVDQYGVLNCHFFSVIHVGVVICLHQGAHQHYTEVCTVPTSDFPMSCGSKTVARAATCVDCGRIEVVAVNESGRL